MSNRFGADNVRNGDGFRISTRRVDNRREKDYHRDVHIMVDFPFERGENIPDGLGFSALKQRIFDAFKPFWTTSRTIGVSVDSYGDGAHVIVTIKAIARKPSVILDVRDVLMELELRSDDIGEEPGDGTVASIEFAIAKWRLAIDAARNDQARADLATSRARSAAERADVAARARISFPERSFIA